MESATIALVVIENPLLDITVQDNEDVVHKKYTL
jgi:adenosine kinase